MNVQLLSNSESLAVRLNAVTNGTDPELAEAIRKEPRLPEMLWWLEWLLRQPCGAEKHIAQIVEDFAPQFGPAFLHDETSSPTPEQIKAAFALLPRQCAEDLLPPRLWGHESGEVWYRHSDVRRYPVPTTIFAEERFKDTLLSLPLPRLKQAFIDNAVQELPGWIRSLFSAAAKGLPRSPFYCGDLLNVLFQAMELHAERVNLKLARTELVDIAFDRLDFCRNNNRLIQIDGAARSGKTTAIEKYAEMRPGKVRLVTIPPGNSLRDLFAAFAEPFGISYTPNTPLQRLKERVQFVIKAARLFLIADESHFLIQAPVSRMINPARLDWVRANIVDRKIPLALVTTAQALSRALDKFSKHTGYNLDQVLGRIDLNVDLPAELSDDDLLRVVGIHAEGIAEKFHPLIVARIVQHGGLLKSVEAICCRARHLAAQTGEETVLQCHLETAFAEVLPAVAAAARPRPAATSTAVTQQHPVAVKRGRSVTAPALELPAPRQTSLTTVNT